MPSIGLVFHLFWRKLRSLRHADWGKLDRLVIKSVIGSSLLSPMRPSLSCEFRGDDPPVAPSEQGRNPLPADVLAHGQYAGHAVRRGGCGNEPVGIADAMHQVDFLRCRS